MLDLVMLMIYLFWNLVIQLLNYSTPSTVMLACNLKMLLLKKRGVMSFSTGQTENKVEKYRRIAERIISRILGGLEV